MIAGVIGGNVRSIATKNSLMTTLLSRNITIRNA